MFDKNRYKEELRTWEEDLRYKYSLPRNPVFFDLGAFKGEWSKRMVHRYGGVSHMFEILPPYILWLRNHFHQPHFFVHPFGLSDQNLKTEAVLTGNPNAFSIFDKGGGLGAKVRFLRMSDWVRTRIDVCKINIEGAEYDLLEHMLEEEVVSLCDNIQVQYHWQYDVPDFYERWLKIREGLSRTHALTFDHYFVWENWRIK